MYKYIIYGEPNTMKHNAKNTFLQKSIKIEQKKNITFRKNAVSLHPNNFDKNIISQ